jgi:flagellar biosynthesis component FlhA
VSATVPVKIELSPELASLAASPYANTLVRRLTALLDALLDGLGVQAESKVELATTLTERPVRVRVHGAVRPYSPDLLLRTWLAVASQEDYDPNLRKPAPADRPFPVHWLEAWVAEAKARDGAVWKLLADYVQRLAHQVVVDHPSCLLGDEQIQEYASDLALSEEDAGFLLRQLLDLHVSIRDRERIRELVSEGTQAGRTIEDTAEAVFTELRRHRIAVHVNPWRLAELLPGAPGGEFSVYSSHVKEALRDLFGDMEEKFFYRFGFLLPDLVWVPDAAVDERTVVVQIDAWWSPPLPMLAKGERLVDASAEELTEFEPRDAVNPATGAPCALVADEAKDAVERAGYKTWGPVDVVLLSVFATLSQRPGKLFGLEELEFQLTSLHPSEELRPLVDATLARYTLGDLTRVRRALIEERLGPRGLASILEALLSYATVPVDDEGLVVLDNRLPVADGGTAEDATAWPSYYAYVRKQLAPYIWRKYAGDADAVDVYRLDDELDERLGRLADDPLSDDELERLRDRVWRLEADGKRSGQKRLVMTTTRSRPLVRAILAPELPAVPVVTHAELGFDVKPRPVGLLSTS